MGDPPRPGRRAAALTAVLAALSLCAGAAAAPAPSPVPLRQAQERLHAALLAVAPAFPGLRGRAMTLEPYEGEDAYFRAWVYGWWRPRESREGRVFAVLYNLKLLQDFPPDDALRGVVAHEAAHLEGFAAQSGWELLLFAFRYAASAEAEAEHERATDRRALERGFARELLAYKRWALERADEKERARRRRVYMTPEEVEEWARANAGSSRAP